MARPNSATSIAATFEKSAKGFLTARRSGLRAHSRGVLTSRDLDHIYTSTFLGVVTSFESFLEELFYSAILGHSRISEVKPLFPIPSRPAAERLLGLSTDRSYLTWTNPKINIKRTSAFTRRGYPFARLGGRGQDKGVLSTTIKVRNAIAHKSGSATRTFLAIMPGTVPSRRRTPAGFLQLGTGGITQHESLTGELLRISKALSASSNKEARAFLGPEDAYQTGHRSGRGTFACKQCRNTVQIRSDRARLPACPSCPASCVACGHTDKSEFERIYH